MAAIIFLVIWLALLVLMIASNWAIFEKAGQAGWQSIIPIWNLVVLLGIVGRPIWWIILFFIPLVNIVMLIVVAHDLAHAFGKGVGFTLGLIFLPIIFYPTLGFGDATYQGKESAGL